VGRTNELQQLEEGLEVGLLQKRKTQRFITFILQGLGGVGKSQFAIVFATRHQTLYIAILWCNGRNKALLRHDVAAIAEQIPLLDVLGTKKIVENETGLEKTFRAVLD